MFSFWGQWTCFGKGDILDSSATKKYLFSGMVLQKMSYFHLTSEWCSCQFFGVVQNYRNKSKFVYEVHKIATQTDIDRSLNFSQFVDMLSDKMK